MKRIAIIGTKGLPANYGGFETLAENLIDSQDHDLSYTVYCSSHAYKNKLKSYKGAKLVYLPFDANGIQSILYDVVSYFHAARKNDFLIILGVSGCSVLPLFRLFFRNKKIIINIDGLEHRRGKWNKFTKLFLKISEFFAINFANSIIVDNKGIQDYVSDTYKIKSTLIAYGGNHALKVANEEKKKGLLSKYNLIPGEYALAICRIEPENNCHLILETFATKQIPIVFVGNWQISSYSIKLHNTYKNNSNIVLIESLYDLVDLHILRDNCKYYIHGHSAGGTNPSLVEAMFFSRPVLAYDCIYNKETTNYNAHYFKDANELNTLLSMSNEVLSSNGLKMREIAENKYDWELIRSQYESLIC